MRGRPKGTTKSNNKKLKTFRLSADELNIVQKTLQMLRNPKPITVSDFQCKDVTLNFINTLPVDEKFLYTFCGTPDEQYIAKCPVISSTARTVTIITKSSSNRLIEKKVNKCDIDRLATFSTYNMALANYLYRYKGRILHRIATLQNPEINTQILMLMSDDILKALEYGAKILKMDYIFRLEDCTVDSFSGSEPVSKRWSKSSIE